MSFQAPVGPQDPPVTCPAALGISRPNGQDCWEQWYREWLSIRDCKGSSCAARLKDAQGHWLAPRKEIVDLLTRYRNVLRYIAERFGVDARAIAAAIIAEHTINYGDDDAMLDNLARTWVGTSALFDRFSMGLTQIKPDIAIDYEPLVARMMGRAPQTNAEVRMALQTPEGSLLYVAAILRTAQDTYRRHGMDVSGQIGVLATLYNLGDFEARAARAQREGRAPQWNYFGVFTEMHLPVLNGIVDEPRR